MYQPIHGYQYNSDTHILYDFVSKILTKYKNKNKTVLDIGAGVGVLGLLLLRDDDRFCLSFNEIQDTFVKFLHINLNTNNYTADIYEGDFLTINFKQKFDIAVSNPPFYDKNVIKSTNKAKQIARYNDNLPLEKLISKASAVLKLDGKLIFCYDAKQIDDVFAFLSLYGFNIEIVRFVHPKPNSNAKIVLVYARKNSNSKTDIYAPLISFDDRGNTSQQTKNIYKNSDIYSIKANL